MEKWKVYERDINYEVSSLGQVRKVGSVMRRKPRFNEHMYMRVNLSNQKSHMIHRMVTETFIKKTDGKNYVNHKNNIPWDNRVKNLEWVTPKENSEHAAKLGCYYNGARVHTSKVTEEQAKHIKYIDKRSNTVIAEEYNMTRQNVSRIRCGKTWKHI